MVLIPDVGPGDPGTSSWANAIRDQGVQVCLSSGRPTGAEGKVIYETDTDKLMAYDGTRWYRPHGEIGYGQATTNQGSINTETDITSCTATVTVGNGQEIKITGYCQVGNNTNAERAVLRIKESTTVLQFARIPLASGGSGLFYTIQAVIRIQPSAGTHTYKLSMEPEVGAATVTVGSSPTAPSFILVEAI
jgi:hypothetical protein